MLAELDRIDRQVLLFFNGIHTDALDPVMYYLTKTEFWLPLYLLLIYLLFRTHGKQALWALAAIAVCILITDQVTSGILKPLVARPRPSHEPSLEGLLHLVNNYRGGKYGFASSHAANTAGVAMFVFLFFRDRYRMIWIMFAWAAVMCYTRLYLGVHYPGDILVGAMIGIGAGWFSFRLYKWLVNRYGKPRDSGSDLRSPT